MYEINQKLKMKLIQKLLDMQLKTVFNYKFEILFHSVFAIFLGYCFSSMPIILSGFFVASLYLWQRYLTYQLHKILQKN
ncbi:hypothetical protein A9267_17615 [Shewanella sp. UCD-FRSSP16_17]|nr:hypothetical protein A9267_17615 [Shewanella sp. UCD-FRSSP16_17]